MLNLAKNCVFLMILGERFSAEEVAEGWIGKIVAQYIHIGKVHFRVQIGVQAFKSEVQQ